MDYNPFRINRKPSFGGVPIGPTGDQFMTPEGFTYTAPQSLPEQIMAPPLQTSEGFEYQMPRPIDADRKALLNPMAFAAAPSIANVDPDLPYLSQPDPQVALNQMFMTNLGRQNAYAGIAAADAQKDRYRDARDEFNANLFRVLGGISGIGASTESIKDSQNLLKLVGERRESRRSEMSNQNQLMRDLKGVINDTDPKSWKQQKTQKELELKERKNAIDAYEAANKARNRDANTATRKQRADQLASQIQSQNEARRAQMQHLKNMDRNAADRLAYEAKRDAANLEQRKVDLAQRKEIAVMNRDSREWQYLDELEREVAEEQAEAAVQASKFELEVMEKDKEGNYKYDEATRQKYAQPGANPKADIPAGSPGPDYTGLANFFKAFGLSVGPSNQQQQTQPATKPATKGGAVQQQAANSKPNKDALLAELRRRKLIK